MEPVEPIKLEALRRDWIVGISGEDFYAKVLDAHTSLEGQGSVCVIREEDPVHFAVRFLTAVSLALPVVLANPKWGSREREEFDQLLQGEAPPPGSILIPTGGTTGGVKLAIHYWASLSAGARAAQDFLGGDPVHSCCLLPLHHVSGLMQLVRSFISGGTISFDVDDCGGRCLSLVPTQLRRMMGSEEGIQKLNTARAVLVGGAAMPVEVAQQARDLKLPVVPVYGMTETAAMVAAIPNADFLASGEAAAVALGDAVFEVDPDGAIRIRSNSLFTGYHGREAIDLSEGFRTGDTGWLDEQGKLYLRGRMDVLINTGGEKVDPAEVRNALLQIDGIVGAQVVGESSEEWGEVVVAYLSGKPRMDEMELRETLKKQLSPYKIPKRFEWA